MRLLWMLVLAVALHATELSIEMKKVFTAGADEMLFAELTDACVTADGDVLILDRRAGRVVRYSAEGKRLGTFGARGRGPGEFAYPGSMACTGDNRVVVCEDQIFVSFFTSRGRFLYRRRVEKGLGLEYISPGLYYAWRWEPGVQQQVLVNPDGVIGKTLYAISRDAFSVSLPDETGRLVMSSFHSPLYTPRFLFARSDSGAAVARSDRYEVRLIDKQGKEERLIARPVAPIPITPAERVRAEAEITMSRRLHDRARKAFTKRIPRHRNFLAGLVLTPDYLMVVRPRADAWADSGPVPVDVFARNGEFLGSISLPGDPIQASRDRMVLREPGEEPMAGVYKYIIKLKS